MPTLVTTSLSCSAIALGGSHTTAMTSTGEAFGWGQGVSGALENGLTEDRWVPTEVSGGLAFDMVDAGGRHTCGVTPAGRVYCWGYGFFGQLGDGYISDNLVPTLISEDRGPGRRWSPPRKSAQLDEPEKERVLGLEPYS